MSFLLLVEHVEMPRLDNITYNNTNTTHSEPHIIPLWVHIGTGSLITMLNFLIVFLYNSMTNTKKNKVPNYLMFVQSLVDLYQGFVSWCETVVEILFRMKILSSMSVIDVVYAGRVLIGFSYGYCFHSASHMSVSRQTNLPTYSSSLRNLASYSRFWKL